MRTLLATVDETLPVLPASTHREVNTHADTHLKFQFGTSTEKYDKHAYSAFCLPLVAANTHEKTLAGCV